MSLKQQQQQQQPSGASSSSRSRSRQSTTGNNGLPDLDSLLASGSTTTFKLKAASTEYDRAQSSGSGSGQQLSGKQAAMQDIEREMMQPASAEGTPDGSDTEEGQSTAGPPPRFVLASGQLPLPEGSPALAQSKSASTTMSRTGTTGTAGTGSTIDATGGTRPPGMSQKVYQLLGNNSPVLGSGGDNNSKPASPIVQQGVPASSPIPKQRSRMSSDAGTVTKNSLRSSAGTTATADMPPTTTVSSLAAAMESPKVKQQQQSQRQDGAGGPRDRSTSFMSDHRSFVHVNNNSDSVSSSRGIPQPVQPVLNNGSSAARDRQASANSILRKVRSRDYAAQTTASTASVNTQGLGIEHEVERFASASSSSAGGSSDQNRRARKLVKGSDDTVRLSYSSNATLFAD